MKSPRRDQFAGCLVGQCLGDASGFLVEGQPPEACRRYVNEVLKTGRVSEPRREGFSFGQYSDDSQLARELLQTYVDRHEFDPSDYASRIMRIFQENRIVGRGWATLQAAERLANGCPWDAAGTAPPSAGNGSAMRAAPIGLLFHDDPEGMVRAAHDQSRITHQDRRCSAGSIAIAGAVVLGLQQTDLDDDEFCVQLSRWIRGFDPILAEAIERMVQWLDLSPQQAVTVISKVGLTDESTDVWPGISPFVTTSVLWSMYSFLRSPNDLWEAICTSVVVGGDVDTTAAMTGAIAGARVGLGGLPSSLARLVTDQGSWGYDDLVSLAYQCYSVKMQGKRPRETV